MARVKALVREHNSYRVSAEHVAQAGEVIEVDSAELKIVPHCLISLEQHEAELARQKQSTSDEVASREAIFNTAREAAIAAAKAQTEAFAITHAQRAEQGNRAAEKAAEAQRLAEVQPPLKIRPPKSDKKPE